jgi:hypothetical protein
MTDHSRSPSSTGIIHISKDSTLDDIKRNIDLMYERNRFDVLGKVQASEFWMHDLVDKVFSVKWAGNSGLPNMHLTDNYDVQKAFLLVKARGWRDHLVVRCRLKKNLRAGEKEKVENTAKKGGRQGSGGGDLKGWQFGSLGRA